MVLDKMSEEASVIRDGIIKASRELMTSSDETCMLTIPTSLSTAVPVSV